MTLSQQQIDQIYADLQAAIRVERNSKKARKIEPDFYRKVVDAIDSMNQEADSLIRSNIDRYLRIKERVRQLESDFRTFYILRFGKIVKLSIYEVETDDLSSLIPLERDFLMTVHNMVNENFDHLLGRRKEEIPKEKVETNASETALPKTKVARSDDVLVRILLDHPPIAQNDKNYVLRKNDIVYLSRKFADLLIKRKSAVEIVQ